MYGCIDEWKLKEEKLFYRFSITTFENDKLNDRSLTSFEMTINIKKTNLV